MDKERLLIITNGNYNASLILNKTISEYKNNIVGVIVVSGDYKGRTGLKSLYELSKITTLPYIIYKLFNYVIFKFVQKSFPKVKFSVEAYTREFKIPIHHATTIKSKGAIDFIKNLRPDLVISVSCPQLIGEKILTIPKFGGINIHASLLPSYAGLAPYYWVLSNGELETGITVHYMTSKFDQGNILTQRKLSIEPHMNSFRLFYNLSILGSEALFESVNKVFDRETGVVQDLSKYSYFSNPNNKSYKSLRDNGHRLINLIEFFKTIQVEIIKRKSLPG